MILSKLRFNSPYQNKSRNYRIFFEEHQS